MQAGERICTVTKKSQSTVYNLTASITEAPCTQPRHVGCPISFQSSLSFFYTVRTLTMSLYAVATVVKRTLLFAFICVCSALFTIAFACTSSSSCLLTTVFLASEARRTPPFCRDRRLPVRRAFRVFLAASVCFSLSSSLCLGETSKNKVMKPLLKSGRAALF